MVLALVTLATGGCERAHGILANRAERPAAGLFRLERIDLGRQAIGAQVEAAFPLRNAGNDARRIVGIRRSCSCQDLVVELQGREPVSGTALPDDGIVVDPNADGVLRVSTTVPDQDVVQSLQLLVDYEHAATDRLVVEFEPTRRFYVVSKGTPVERIDLGALPRDRSATFSFVVASADGDRFEIAKHGCSQPGLRITGVERDDDGTDWTVAGALEASTASGGVVTLTLTNANAGTIELAVPVDASRLPAYRVSPGSVLAFGRMTGDAESARSASITAYDDRPVEIEEAKLVSLIGSPDHVRVTHERTQGGAAAVTVAILPDHRPGTVFGRVRVLLADGEAAEFDFAGVVDGRRHERDATKR